MARTPFWASACYWSAIIAVAGILAGGGIGAFSPGVGAGVIGLSFTGCLVVWVLAGCYHGVRVAGLAALLLWRIPVVLFFHARMYLIELLLIVTLLGNGVGLILAHGDDDDPVATLFLSAVWVIAVLGGAAWGLWVSTVMKLQRTTGRCVLVLTGIAFPAATAGLLAGPIWLIAGLADLPGRTINGLLIASLGAATTAVSFLVFRHAIRFHTQARNAAATERIKRRREEVRRQREEAIASLEKSLSQEDKAQSPDTTP